MRSFSRCVVAVTALLALAACGATSSSVIPPPTGPPNPSSTKISVTVQVCSGGVCVSGPGVGVKVTLSTGWDSTNHTPTGVITSQRTNKNGDTTFSNLPRSGQLCTSAELNRHGHRHVTAYCAQPFPKEHGLELHVG